MLTEADYSTRVHARPFSTPVSDAFSAANSPIIGQRSSVTSHESNNQGMGFLQHASSREQSGAHRVPAKRALSSI